MSYKIYIKKGNKNYKEVKLLKKLTNAINQRLQEDPNFEFEPARNFGELQRLHDTLCIEDVNFIEKQEVNTNEPILQKMENNDDFLNDDNSFVDPLNREEPEVRDYVMKNEFQTKENKANSQRREFDEPLTFEDSFEIPTEGDNQQDNQQRGQRAQRPQREQRERQREPMNPDFDDMSNAKKKRSTKKMAKYIVQVICTLAEKGFEWFANKDINETKLAEYELSGEIDLSLMLALEDGQQATVREFFTLQCLRAEQLSKISEEERSDLADALAEVMLEKGVAPTPMQELILISVGIFGKQALTLWQITSQNNAVLAQLKAIATPKPVQEPVYRPTPEPVRQEPMKQETVKQEPVVAPKTELKEEYTYEESLILDQPINTIE